MKLGIIGKLFPLMFRKTVYGYTEKAVPGLDIRAFQSFAARILVTSVVRGAHINKSTES